MRTPNNINRLPKIQHRTYRVEIRPIDTLEHINGIIIVDRPSRKLYESTRTPVILISDKTRIIYAGIETEIFEIDGQETH